MFATELKEIKEYWTTKYPHVQVVLFEGSDKYFGKMSSHNRNLDLEAFTIGDLINQGENFLRKVTQ